MKTEIVSTKYLKDTLKLKNEIEGVFLQLGERLYNIRKDEIWKGAYNNYSEFLQEMGISEGHASKLVQIYARFVLEYGIKQAILANIGIKKLYAIIPLCTNKNSLKSALEQIEGLSSADVERLSKDQQAGAHKHIDQAYLICSVCKRMKKDYGEK